MLENVQRRRIPLPERGVEISVLDWGGTGPPALLHHANGFSAALWDGVAQDLRGHYRLFAIDARGHGDSSRPEGPQAYQWSEMAEDLAAVGHHLLEEIGAPRFALGLGHSFGGTLSFTASALYPDLYERVCGLDPVILPPPSQEGERAGRGPDLAVRARKRRDRFADREEAIAFFASRELFESWRPEMLELYVDEGLRVRGDGVLELKCPGEVEAAIFEGNQGINIFELAPEVRVPCRLLWATHGNFPRAVYERLVSSIPRGDIEDIDAGHLMTMEEPALVAQAVLRFASEASTAPESSP